MELSESIQNKIKEIVSKLDNDSARKEMVSVFKDRWDKSTIEDENLRAIQCGILTDSEALDTHNKWSAYDLSNYGIEINKFWSEIIEKNQDKIKSELDAIKVVHEALVRKLRSPAKKFMGGIVGVGMKNDNFAKYINEVLENYKQDPEQVILAKQVEIFNDIEAVAAKYPSIGEHVKASQDKYFIDGNFVIPIGKKNIIITGRDGKKVEKKNWFGGRYAGKPVVGSNYMQTVNMIVKEVEKEDSKYEWKETILNGDLCDTPKPMNRMIEVVANVSPSDKSKLNSTDNTRFDTIGDIEPDQYEEIKKVAMRRGLKFDEILDFAKKTNGKSYDVKVVEAKIMDTFSSDDGTTILISENKEKTTDDMKTLFDDKGELMDNSMYCKLPSNIPVNFGRSSIVLLFGNIGYGSSKEGNTWVEDKTKCKLWVKGVLVSKEHQVEPQNINATQDEVDTTKWKDEVTK